MNLEASTTELLLHNDPRLLAAIQAVIEFACEGGGLSEAACAELETAANAACREAFSLVGSNGDADPIVRMIVTEFPDRVEVAIEHRGNSSVGQNLKNVDRVDSKIQGGTSRTTLVKFGAASKSEHGS